MGRGGKVGITLLVIVLLLFGALVAADRIAANAAEDRIATEAGKELSARSITTAGPPSAHIAGFPFLTQVLGGKYQKITIDVPRPAANGVQLDNLKVVATNVRADAQSVMNGTGSVTANRVVGTARMGWDAVRSALDVAGLPGVDPAAVQVSVVEDRVEMRLPLDVLGDRITLKANGTLQVDQGAVRLRVASLGTEGGTPQPAVQRIIDQYRNRLAVNLRVPAMPYRLVIDKVETGQSGVYVSASADQVKLN